MNLQNLRWPVVLVTMAATVAALLGVGFVLKSQTVEEPLKKVYASSPAVLSYTFERQSDKYVIKTRLKDVPDLASVYHELDEETARVLKGSAYTITVEDGRNSQLEDSFRRINLYVQEALATGQYATMADRVDAEATKAGLTARFNVDSDHVYVQLHTKDGAYLYNVAERAHSAKEDAARTEGGMGL